MYGDIGNLKYLYFILALILYVSVIFANTALIVIIYLKQNLHEPMYLFLCSLFVNDIYGSTALLPCLMVQILSETHDISLFFCFIQIFNIQTYIDVEFRSLAIMAYDRYVCICKPLHYNSIITTRRVQIVVLVIWIVSFVQIGVLLSFTIRLRFCGTVIDKEGCVYHLVLQLSCSLNTLLSFLNDVVFGLVFGVFAPLVFISFTYVKILSVCLKASKETKTKAFDTCTPHLVSIISFVFFCFYNIMSQRFDMLFVPLELQVILTLYAFLIQPLLNPLIYGLKLSKIRQALKKLC
ncbi:olfactory receptor 11A1-like [Channa argus]|uniref:olfactory receptor 11A1-like n=1 Tax=Channa argus TaxID=215402 RepID=UPI003521A1A1